MPPDSTGANGSVVFIVDDDEGVRSSLQLLVRSLGLSSEAFSSGEGFLEAYDGRDAGCVLLDVRMPGMSGFEVRERLDAMGATIPVIFLTAEGEDEIPARIGPVERIQKPFDDEQLVRRIRESVGPADD